jgi:hypothetical protein
VLGLTLLVTVLVLHDAVVAVVGLAPLQAIRMAAQESTPQ